MNEQQEILAKQNFHEEMLKLFKRTAKEVKYKATRRLDLINKYGGYEAAIKILPTDSNTFDFTLLWEQERLDLSIEALVVKQRYAELFPEDVVAFCQKRLDEYNYAPKKITDLPDDIDDFLENLLVSEETTQASEAATIKQPDEDDFSTLISLPAWYDLLTHTSVFTASNRDLMIKMFELGETCITPDKLYTLEGYNEMYPFYDVSVALCKRIKTALKLEMPQTGESGVEWWKILYQGSVSSKKVFEWYLRKDLKGAIVKLSEEGVIPPLKHLTAVKEHLPSEEHLPIEEHLPSEAHLPNEESLQSEESSSSQESLLSKGSLQSEVHLVATDNAVTVPVEVTTEPVREEVHELVQELCTVGEEQAIEEDGVITPALKKACKDYYGAVCDLCGFDFGYTYGEKFEDCIHIHLVEEDEQLANRTIDPHKDLIPICSNCRTVMLSQTPNYTIAEMKQLLKNNM